jgi:gamma-glutamyl hydrolase
MRNQYLATLFALLVINASAQFLNPQPVVGILTIPTDPGWDYPSDEYNYFAASYVQFLEAAGARVVPLPWDADNITDYLDILNGVLFTGGGSSVTTSVEGK